MKLDTLERTPHLPSRIAQALLKQITEGTLNPGDRLPTEQGLAVSFGVSRNVVREAVARLRSEGIVQSKQGVGAFVARRSASSTLRIDAEVLADTEAFAHVFELRATLEIKAASLAAQRADEDDVGRILTALDRMRGEEKWTEGGVDADLAFHRSVAMASRNPYIAQVLGFVSEQIRLSIIETRRRSPAVEAIVDVTIAEHEAIYEAIRRRQPVEARRLMGLHIRHACVRVGLPTPDAE